MKKKMLFVIDSLHCAGAEKSLVTLLSLLDYNQYEVDLQLFGYGGVLEEMLPKEVNLLPPLEYFSFANLKVKEVLKLNKLRLLSSRLRYSFLLRIKNYSNIQKARVFWQSVSSVIETNPKVYDIAISYAQGVPTFYVGDKIKACKKYAWINTSYNLTGKEKIFQKKFYENYNNIVLVSQAAYEIFANVYPEYKNRLTIIYDINNPDFIFKMSQLEKPYSDEYKGLRLLTIGRLAKGKGYDIAISACEILKDRGYKFKWYVLGVGGMESKIKESIEEKGLREDFILLGLKVNPYPFIKNCDIYIQTSRFEGFGLAIAEARMLNKPVVTTRFDSVYNQMIHEKNGLVVDMNGEAVANGIERLIIDNQLKSSIIHYLENEKKGNIEELKKFYELVENF
ncbi:MAG: glycosyltransferase [Turicibacter sanguinis]